MNLRAKIVRVAYTQCHMEYGCSETGPCQNVRNILWLTDCDVVHCRQNDVGNQFAPFSILRHKGFYPDEHRLYELGR